MIVPLQNATRLVLQNAPSNYLLINENNFKKKIFILGILLYGQAFYKKSAIMYG
jgi:hypothetical protein